MSIPTSAPVYRQPGTADLDGDPLASQSNDAEEREPQEIDAPTSGPAILPPPVWSGVNVPGMEAQLAPIQAQETSDRVNRIAKGQALGDLQYQQQYQKNRENAYELEPALRDAGIQWKKLPAGGIMPTMDADTYANSLLQRNLAQERNEAMAQSKVVPLRDDGSQTTVRGHEVLYKQKQDEARANISQILATQAAPTGGVMGFGASQTPEAQAAGTRKDAIDKGDPLTPDDLALLQKSDNPSNQQTASDLAHYQQQDDQLKTAAAARQKAYDLSMRLADPQAWMQAHEAQNAGLNADQLEQKINALAPDLQQRTHAVQQAQQAIQAKDAEFDTNAQTLAQKNQQDTTQPLMPSQFQRGPGGTIWTNENAAALAQNENDRRKFQRSTIRQRGLIQAETTRIQQDASVLEDTHNQWQSRMQDQFAQSMAQSIQQRQALEANPKTAPIAQQWNDLDVATAKAIHDAQGGTGDPDMSNPAVAAIVRNHALKTQELVAAAKSAGAPIEEPSIGGVAARGLLRNALPAIGGNAAGGWLGALAGGALEGAVGGSLVPGWGTLIGGIAGGLAGMYGLKKLQDVAANAVNPTTSNPLSTASEEQDVAAHPIINELSGLAVFKPNPMKLANALKAVGTAKGRQLIVDGFKANKALYEMPKPTTPAEAAIYTLKQHEINDASKDAIAAYHNTLGVGANVGVGAGMGVAQGDSIGGILRGAATGALFNDSWFHGKPQNPITDEQRKTGQLAMSQAELAPHLTGTDPDMATQAKRAAVLRDIANPTGPDTGVHPIHTMASEDLAAIGMKRDEATANILPIDPADTAKEVAAHQKILDSLQKAGAPPEDIAKAQQAAVDAAKVQEPAVQMDPHGTPIIKQDAIDAVKTAFPETGKTIGMDEDAAREHFAKAGQAAEEAAATEAKNVRQRTSSTLTSTDENGKARQKDLQGVSGQSKVGAEEMSGMPRSGHEGMAENSSPEARAAEESERKELRARISRQGPDSADALRRLRGLESRDASRGLRQAHGRDLGVSAMSSEETPDFNRHLAPHETAVQDAIASQLATRGVAPDVAKAYAEEHVRANGVTTEPIEHDVAEVTKTLRKDKVPVGKGGVTGPEAALAKREAQRKAVAWKQDAAQKIATIQDPNMRGHARHAVMTQLLPHLDRLQQHFPGGITFETAPAGKSGFSYNRGTRSLNLDINRIAREKGLESPQALNERVGTALQEEHIHRYQDGAFRTPAEADKWHRDMWDSLGMSPEGKELRDASLQAYHTHDTIPDAEKLSDQEKAIAGQELMRQIIQGELTNQVTEAAAANPSWTKQIKDFLSGFVKWLSGQVKKLPESDRAPIEAMREKVIKLIKRMEATEQEKAEAELRKGAAALQAQSAAQTRAPPAEPKVPKSSTQLTFKPADAKPILDFGKSIPAADIYSKPDEHGQEDYGRETEPHVTALYGLTQHDPDPVQQAIAGHGPVTVTLGKTSLFTDNSDYDVLKVDVTGKSLHDLNAKIAKLPNANTFPTYKPHVTIAYLKKGIGSRFAGDARFKGKQITFDTLTFSPPKEIRDQIGRPELPLTEPASTETPTPSAETNATPEATKPVDNPTRAKVIKSEEFQNNPAVQNDFISRLQATVGKVAPPKTTPRARGNGKFAGYDVDGGSEWDWYRNLVNGVSDPEVAMKKALLHQWAFDTKAEKTLDQNEPTLREFAGDKPVGEALGDALEARMKLADEMAQGKHDREAFDREEVARRETEAQKEQATAEQGRDVEAKRQDNPGTGGEHPEQESQGPFAARRPSRDDQTPDLFGSDTPFNLTGEKAKSGVKESLTAAPKPTHLPASAALDELNRLKPGEVPTPLHPDPALYGKAGEKPFAKAENLRKAMETVAKRMAADKGSLVPDATLPKQWENLTRAYKESVGELAKIEGQQPALFSSRRPEVEPGFYSHLAHTIDTKMPASASVDQIKNIVNGGGVKAEEVKWSGLMPWLESKGGKISKTEVAEYLRNEGAVKFEEHRIGEGDLDESQRTPMFGAPARTKYEGYQLPGGSNYREVVLAMPQTETLPTGWKIKPAAFGSGFTVFDGSGSALITRDSPQEAIRAGIEYRTKHPHPDDRSEGKQASRPFAYFSSHFPEVPNYVAHMRLNDRVDADGKPGTFMEELQSDRHQVGREHGYDNEALFQDLLKRRDAAPDDSPQQEELQRQINEMGRTSGKGVPDAPFRSTWPLQLFKRALRDAVASGHKWIGWTDGKTQADRYDLSHQVEELNLFNSGEGTWDISARTKEDRKLKDIATGIKADKLPDYVGKDMANKAISSQTEKGWKTYTGVDLKVGGSGMTGFYDQILPKEIGKYVKQWGGKVEDGGLKTNDHEKPFGEVTPIHRVTITTEMAKGVEEGQSLFAGSRPLMEPTGEKVPGGEDEYVANTGTKTRPTYIRGSRAELDPHADRPEDRIAKAYRKLSDWGKPVRLADLRNKLPEMSWLNIEKGLATAHAEGKAFFSRFDDPQSLTADDKKYALKAGDTDRHLVIFKEPAEASPAPNRLEQARASTDADVRKLFRAVDRPDDHVEAYPFDKPFAKQFTDRIETGEDPVKVAREWNASRNRIIEQPRYAASRESADNTIKAGNMPWDEFKSQPKEFRDGVKRFQGEKSDESAWYSARRFVTNTDNREDGFQKEPPPEVIAKAQSEREAPSEEAGRGERDMYPTDIPDHKAKVSLNGREMTAGDLVKEMGGMSLEDAKKLPKEAFETVREFRGLPKSASKAEIHRSAVIFKGNTSLFAAPRPTVPAGAPTTSATQARDALKATTDAVKSAGHGVQNILAPHLRDAEAAREGRIVNAEQARGRRNYVQMDDQTHESWKFMEKASDPTREKYIDALEDFGVNKKPINTGNAEADKHLKAISAFDLGRTQSVKDQAAALGITTWDKFKNFVKYQVPHLFKDPEAAEKILDQHMPDRKLGGSKEFMEHREVPTWKELREMGLEPKYTNPLDLMYSRWAEQERFLAEQRIIKQSVDDGIFRWLKRGEQMRPGEAEVKTTAAAKEVGDGSYLVGNENPARIIAHMNSRGLGDKAWFRAWRNVGNAMNTLQLGFSGFHAVFTGLDSIQGDIALGMKNLLEGHVGEGLKNIAMAPAAPIRNIRRGMEMQQAYLHPETASPLLQNLMRAAVEGGAKLERDPAYEEQMWKSMNASLRTGTALGYLGGALKAPLALSEYVMKPIMGKMVPHLKRGAFYTLMERELRHDPTLHDPANLDRLRTKAGEVWNSVENRLGQLDYDRLHWHKITKDIAQGTTRSVGWNLGTFREVFGGAKDTAVALKRLAGLPLGGQSPEVTHRMAYFLAMNLTVAAAGVALQKLLTGEDPEDYRDAFFPRTGGVDKYGKPERIVIPSYFKDQQAFVTAPFTTLGHKANPLLSTLASIISNKDYSGAEVYNPRDPITSKIWDIGKQVAKSFVPFSVTGGQKFAATSKISPLAALAGIQPAPGRASMSTAEKIAYDYAQSQRRDTRTQEAAAKSQAFGQALTNLRTGQPVAPGSLPPGGMTKALKMAGLTPLQAQVQREPYDVAQQVYAAATPKERASLAAIMAKKQITARKGIPLSQIMAGTKK